MEAQGNWIYGDHFRSLSKRLNNGCLIIYVFKESSGSMWRWPTGIYFSPEGNYEKAFGEAYKIAMGEENV